jgi:hypothetical protein
LKIEEIKTNPKNPRRITADMVEKLKKSIEGFPKMMEIRPIIIDESGVILGGNMRYLALKRLGYKEIPDSWVKKASDLTSAEKREFIIKDNSNFGEWDFDILAEEWGDLPLDDWGLDMPELDLEIPVGNKEIDEDEMKETKNECPKCGFKW